MGTEAQFAAIVKALRADPRVTEMKMFGAPGLRVSGKVFCTLYKGDLVLKLPAERVDKLIRARDGKHWDPGHGRVMKEWVSVTTSKRGQWMTLATEARDFVAAGAKKTARPKAKSR